MVNKKQSFKLVKTSSLRISPYNIRTLTKRGKEELEEIKQSIKSKGIIEPLIIRKKEGKYEVVVGQRRFLACKQLGLKEVPCIVKKLTEQEAIEYSLIENLQRKDVDAIDVAEALKKLHDMTSDLSIRKFGEKIGREVGLSWEQIRQYLSLVGLTPEVKELVSEGKITIESGAKLKQLPEESQKEFAEEFEKVIEEKPITQAVEEEIVKKVREHPEKVKEVVKEVVEKVSPDYITIIVKSGRSKSELKMKKKYFDYLSEVAERLNTTPLKLLEEIIITKLKEWGYRT